MTRQAALLGATASCVAVAALATGVALTWPPSVIGLPEAGVVIRTAVPVVRLMATSLAVATFGLGLLRLLLPNASELDSVSRRAVLASAVGWVLTLAITLWLQASELSPAERVAAIGDEWSYGLEICGGRGLLSSIAAAVVVMVCSQGTRRWQQVAGLVPAAVGVIAVPLSGHASQGSQPWLTMTAIGLHVVAVAAWVGGLGAVAVVVTSDRVVLAEVLPRFSRVAELSIITVLITGLLLTPSRLTRQALPRVPQVLGALTGTPAGWLVLAKLACVVALAGLGGYTRWRILPVVARGERTAFLTFATLEITVMAAAIAVATALARPL
ncbi:copper resistance D family protein [Kribbella sp. NPDC055110]